jgi:hypothetical protein
MYLKSHNKTLSMSQFKYSDVIRIFDEGLLESFSGSLVLFGCVSIEGETNI